MAYSDKAVVVSKHGSLLTSLVICGMIVEIYSLFDFYIGFIVDESCDSNNIIYAKQTLPEVGCTLLAKYWGYD